MSALLASTAHAQWSDDSTMHQVVADGAGEQVQPKIAPTADGGCYISWFSSVSGYDVRLQRLDASGNEMWAHNGILVADRGFSSTQDYDLDVDTSGHAVICFRDDRFGGTKITAQRFAPDGTPTWGANGIQFGNGTDFVASPDIATTTDGNTVVGWINEADSHFAMISQAGAVLWNTVLNDAGGDSIQLASMHGSDNGSVIASWVQYSNFLGPKHLYAQKLDSSGNESWASRVAVYDGGSLQFGNFPEFVTDGSGGAVFSWYDTANALRVYAQRVLSTGAEAFSHNGVNVSTSNRDQVSPTVTFYPHNNTTYIAWVELDNNQSSQGVYAQRLNVSGNHTWTNGGNIVSPIDGLESSSINTHISDGNLIVSWIENNGTFGQDKVLARAVAPSGVSAWPSGTIEVASDLADRSRLTTALSSDGFVIAGWQAGGTGSADIETHNINPDGSLGASPCPADFTGDGALDFFDVSAFLAAFGAMDPIADFTGEGAFDFFDVSAFLAAFGAGCP